MERIFKHIKNKFQQLKKPTDNAKENTKLLLGILGVYASINLLPLIYSLILKLPSGLFLILLFNLIVIFWLSLKTYFDFLTVKRFINEKNPRKVLINATRTINQSLCIGFNIYILLCLIQTH